MQLGSSSAWYEAGIGTILLDDVWCHGSEARLIGYARKTSSRNCTHSENVGVRCKEDKKKAVVVAGAAH